MACPIAVMQFLACLMWVCCTKSIFQFLTAYKELRTVYIPHASLVSVVFVKLSCEASLVALYLSRVERVDLWVGFQPALGLCLSESTEI